MGTLDLAIEVAAKAHAGQEDKGGAPYILHPLRVMLAVKPEDRIVAVLHDVVEDSQAYTLAFLGALGFSPTVIEALDALTRREGESYADFIKRCGENDVARRVKMADLNDNMQLCRIPKPTLADAKRVDKYARALATLRGGGDG